VEGLAGDELHRLQRAWLAEAVPQCGYCHPGMLMQAALLLARTANPSETEIEQWMAGNLCRCGTYARITRAIRRAATEVVDDR
jgi:isoquinoline 1-oxidoreductase subunit alpha